jgi:hypothetical protein
MWILIESVASEEYLSVGDFSAPGVARLCAPEMVSQLAVQTG